ncbi:MAG: citrate/2-methylcitrate synthase [Spirochaetales bacterium]|nr:citrate/2-methylcitrate synthase [Spirochaetales bacterium]
MSINVTNIIVEARQKALEDTKNIPIPPVVEKVDWPVSCTVGPGLEGAISAETKVGYVNGQKGWLVYRGYNIFDLCAHSNFEEVSFLLLHGRLPNAVELKDFQATLRSDLKINQSLRLLMSFDAEHLSPMAALRLGINLMRQRQTFRDKEGVVVVSGSIASDEDSIPMETLPKGEKEAIYSFQGQTYTRPASPGENLAASTEMDSCYRLIAGVASITAAIIRLRAGKMPLEPLEHLSHAGNLLYLMTGKEPSALETRIMDVSLILHADHGMNASTFASMVVASTLSDIYFSIGSGVAALSGPLHGGANEEVIKMLQEIGEPENVTSWYKKARAEKRKIPGFGHRVYKAYDPRARILGPLAEAVTVGNPEMERIMATAKALEALVVVELGGEKKIFPNVDFYSGIVYKAMGLPAEVFTPLFAVSRVSGWTARVMEYLERNRIFRPRAIYTGEFYEEFPSLESRG